MKVLVSRICFLMVLLVSLTLMTSLGMAQTPTPAGAPNTAGNETKESSGIARAEKDVPVPQPKADKAIADRLVRILNLTGWFEGLRVTSQEGVVTLYGKVAEVSQKDWAVDLANDADGVVAVIDKVDLKETAWFDLTTIQNEMKGMWKKFFIFIPSLLVGLLILVLSFVVFRFFSKINKRFWAGRIQNPILSDVIAKLGALPILLIGVYLVLQVWSLTGLAFTVLGGTGALGLVAGFAFKNILENYFSGIMLSLRKPFVVGDQIEVAGESGIVFKMTTRGTTLIDADGKHVLIPNSTVFTSIIRNKSAGGVSRVSMTFEAKPEDIAGQKARLTNFLKERKDIVKDPQMDVFVSGTAEKPTLTTYFWVDAQKTNIEKLKNVLPSEYGLDSVATSPNSSGSQSDETSNEIQAVLARAALTPSQPNEKHL